MNTPTSHLNGAKMPRSSALVVSVKNSFSYRLQVQLTMIAVLVINEIRLRSRRLSTLVAMLAMMALSWSMIVDPASGTTLIAIKEARVLYTSSSLAMGSASLFSFLMALIGFYLVRGRISEDIRSGIGSVIASTPVSNSVFLLSRWLGGVAYMLILIGAAMIAMLILHLVRGDESIRLWVYLQTYGLVLAPMVFFAVSLAILFDSVPVLMGKAGDVIYFFMWMAQVSLLSKIDELAQGQLSGWLLLDFSGLATTILCFKSFLHTEHFSLGASSFNPELATITLPVALWSMKLALLRMATALVAIVPLLPAFFLFHRFSPDRVKQSHSRKRRSPLELINTWTRPIAKQAHPLFVFAARRPNLFGQTMAELALSLVSAPIAIMAIVMLTIFTATCRLESLHGVLLPAIVIWGIVIADMFTRDYQAGIETMTAATRGGAGQRYVRQLLAAFSLGILLTGVALFRLSFVQPMLAVGLIVGILMLSLIAGLLGKATNTSRTFLSLFLSWVYVASQVPKSAILDVVGFNQVDNWQSILLHVEITVVSVALSYALSRFKST